MRRSNDRILVTHQGTLPRASELRDLVIAREEGRPYDEAALATSLKKAVRELVGKQRDLGIDYVNDGEQSKSANSIKTNSARKNNVATQNHLRLQPLRPHAASLHRRG